ncbi:hypothetical protein [Mariniflexile sp. AS56]|uniref:hypothetical protein n=1 Tax=Mariniflexile sp. AS56 TaxID=3063957 RepID=UPI0026EF2798|nr:hypothetical protein [Mariniflexile sp. AS56]MDO7171203.1 hypothetical protein [Mariniflexile sp. AS56]
MTLKVIKLYLIGVLYFGLTLFSCESDSDSPKSVSTDPCENVMPTPDSLRYFSKYEKPVITAPETVNAQFYSDEVIEIKWDLPEGLWNSQLQIIELDTPYDCLDYEKFHALNNNFSAGYGNQFSHYFFLSHYNGIITDTVYVAYRIRTTDNDYPIKYSIWSDVNTFTIIPLASLKKEVITVSYDFDFITEEAYKDYYSGVLTKKNYKLKDIALDYNLDYDHIRFVRPIKFETHFVTKFDDNKTPFSRIMIGFDEDFEYNKEFYPFEVFADVYPGSYEDNPVKGNQYRTNSGNYVSEMNAFDLKVAYKLEDVIGSQHRLKIDLTYEVFSDENTP